MGKSFEFRFRKRSAWHLLRSSGYGDVWPVEYLFTGHFGRETNDHARLFGDFSATIGHFLFQLQGLDPFVLGFPLDSDHEMASGFSSTLAIIADAAFPARR